MIIIYRPADIIEAQLIADQLKARGIESHIGGQYLQGGIGELATMDFITLQVDDADQQAAMSVISDYQSVLGHNSTGNDKVDNNTVDRRVAGRHAMWQSILRQALPAIIVVAASIVILVTLAAYYG